MLGIFTPVQKDRFHFRDFLVFLLNYNIRLLKDTYADDHSWWDMKQKNPTTNGHCMPV